MKAALITVLMISFLPLLPGAKRPDIVFIMADDLGYGDFGCYEATDIRTPHLDQLVAEGLLMTDFCANGAVCSPTRIAFLTGRYQQRLGMDNALYYQEMGRGLPENGPTQADALVSPGYVTGLSGNCSCGRKDEPGGNRDGLDRDFVCTAR